MERIGRIPSFKDQGIDIESTGMDCFAVRSTVDTEKQKILRGFALKVYAEPDFRRFMADLGMSARTGAMAKYIPLIP